MTLRPMLSATIEDLSKLRLPLLASPKLDGIRAMIVGGVVTSRSGKPIPNQHVQSMFGLSSYNGLDGELIMGDPTSATCFRDTTSAVMTRYGEPGVMFHIFDLINPKLLFVDRLQLATNYAKHHRMTMVPQYVMESQEEILNFEENCLKRGYEGIMLRDPAGAYKYGRSTMNEQGLMKLKRFKDSEAVVVGVEERMRNENAATIDTLGYTTRSTHKENMQGRGDLGALLVRDLTSGVEFSIGSGFDDALRAKLWVDKPLGKTVKYKYFPLGSKDKPRFPIFVGFREDL